MNYVPPIPLEAWQVVLAPILGGLALATAGLPLLFWWWRKSAVISPAASPAGRPDGNDSTDSPAHRPANERSA